MRLSTRVRYAVRAIIDLAIHSKDTNGLVLLKDIARRQEVSVKYLENIFATLRKAGLVRGVRGAKGGYALTRDPAKITVYDIVFAMQGFIAPIGCLEDVCGCTRMKTCASVEIWSELTKSIQDVLQRYTVADLADRHTPKDFLSLKGEDSLTSREDK